jgi:hypothetical protein
LCRHSYVVAVGTLYLAFSPLDIEI